MYVPSIIDNAIIHITSLGLFLDARFYPYLLVTPAMENVVILYMLGKKNSKFLILLSMISID